MVNYEKQYRIARDIIRRSKAGIWSYSLVWPVIALDGALYESIPWLFWPSLGAFLLIALARVWHNRTFEKMTDEQIEGWHFWQYILVPASVFIWSLNYCYSLILTDQSLAVVMAISTAGLTAGGVNSTIPNKRLAYIFANAGLVPCLLVTLYLGEWVLMIMILAFLSYLLQLAHNSNLEYEKLLDNERRLEQQQEQLMAMSQVDALTQLSNRRHFDQRLDEIWRFCRRENLELSLLVIDIDYFKKVNDQYGHLLGDECLKHVAGIIKQIVKRDTDVVARFGGEEFVILLPTSELAMAKMVAEKIRSKVEATPLEHDIHHINLTVSIGTASLIPDNDSDAYELFEQADQAMYQAKQNGRNQCQ